MSSAEKQAANRAAQQAIEVYKRFGRLIAQAWMDPNLEQQLRANPTKVMRDHGIPVPANVTIDPATVQLPPKPQGLDAEAFLEEFGPSEASAAKTSCVGSFSCPPCTVGSIAC